ncbi:MAG: glycosyltransferase family 4 protein, partial [Gammaproteobacteria bacterium]|nr:glycosyltransferase family 4 protein [Gammaproteobacteria bacterium]
PWSGIPILSQRQSRYRTIYEVNGLPSIELPYAYPLAAPKTLKKIRDAEEFCWTHADRLITPSDSIRNNLIRLGASPDKITVIPNGADIQQAPSTASISERYIIYVGALQRWQGLDVLLRAFARLADLEDLRLVVCASTHQRRAKPYRKLAEKLGIDSRIDWHFRLAKKELVAWLNGALVSVAALTECSRNLEQGCCPLKVLESMAAGVPVVASDLPSIREIMKDGIHGRLVRAERPAELARAIRILLEYPQQARNMGIQAQTHIRASFSWDVATTRLSSIYQDLCDTSSSINPASRD